jgi:hypothetical protein
MNRSSSTKCLAALGLSFLAATLTVLPAQSEMGAAPRGQPQALAATLPGPINPSFTITSAGHVANGCGLRNSRSCQIRMRGLPAGSTIVKALVYWAFTSTTGTGSAKQSTITFAGNVVTGTLVGSGIDACWCGGTNVVYRAGVKRFVTGNGAYGVALSSGATPQTNGASPWRETVCPTNTNQGLADGASLVVVYTLPSENGTTLIYDSGLAGREFGASLGLSYTLDKVPAPGEGSSIFTEIGADGQIGSALTAFLTSKTTSLNSTPIAGPGAAAVGGDNDSDWNGTDGTPLNQLWDTHSHDVTGIVGPTSEDVSIIDNTRGRDCLIAVANVLSIP